MVAHVAVRADRRGSSRCSYCWPLRGRRRPDRNLLWFVSWRPDWRREFFTCPCGEYSTHTWAGPVFGFNFRSTPFNGEQSLGG